MTTPVSPKDSKRKSRNILFPFFVALSIVAAGVYFFSATFSVTKPKQETSPSTSNNSAEHQQKNTAAPVGEKNSSEQRSLFTPPEIKFPKEQGINNTREKEHPGPRMPQMAVQETDNTVQATGGTAQESLLNKATTATDQESPVTTSHHTPLERINAFYDHIDQQKYLTPYELDTPSRQYFSTLLQKIVDNPPIVTGETDDLFNVLQNTAHFFRIVGKKDIDLLKTILDKEKNSFEDIAAQFYKATATPEKFTAHFGITIPPNAIYDYAGFFLTTMGGRLYLFRRDAQTRIVATYYSIRIIDNSNDQGENSRGIDILPAITLLISELENGGASLKMREDYLDILYILKDKYHR